MQRWITLLGALAAVTTAAPAQDYTQAVEIKSAGAPGNMAWRTDADAGPVLAMEGHVMHFAGPPVAGAPYSAEAVNTIVQTLNDGNRIERENRSKVWRDSQGRTRREETLGSLGPWATPGEPRTMIFIDDPVAGEHYIIDPKERTVRKMPKPKLHPQGLHEKTENVFIRKVEIAGDGDRGVAVGGSVGGPPLPPPTPDGGPVTFAFRGGAALTRATPDAATESLGSDVIQGVAVEGTRVTTTIPAGAIGNERDIVSTFERWHSPELGVDVKTVRKDPRQGEFVYELQNIQRTEPAGSLFVPPADYTVEEGPQFREIHLKDEE